MSLVLTPEQALGSIWDQIGSDLWSQYGEYCRVQRRSPRYLYINDGFYRDAPANFVHDVEQVMFLKVRTSKLMPYEGALLTYDEFNADDLAKHLAGGGKIGLI